MSESSRSHQRLEKIIYTALAASFLPVTQRLGMGCTEPGLPYPIPLPISSPPLAAFNAEGLSINYNPEMKGFVLPAED